MKAKVIKPKLYTFDENSTETEITGYMFLKHIRPSLKKKNENRKYLYGLTSLYRKKINSSNEYIQILPDVKKTKDEFTKYINETYFIDSTKFSLVEIINVNKLVIYLILLDYNLNFDEYLSNYGFISETIMEMITRKRLEETDDYWGLLSVPFMISRKKYLNKCLCPNDSRIKLEMRFKKVYKALIGK